MSYQQSKLEILKTLKTLMSEEVIIPEPHFNVFSKYLAEQSQCKGDKNETLVYITNSHGVQLRSDVKFWMNQSSRNECKNKPVHPSAPVIDFDHLALFKDYDEILRKIKELPEEWTVIQITQEFAPSDVFREMKDSQNPSIILTRFSCGKLAERLHPYYINVKSRNQVEKSFMVLLKEIIQVRRDYYSSGGTARKIKEEYLQTDPRLMKFLVEVENHWLKEWRCLLNGRLEDKILETKVYKKVKNALSNFEKKGCEKVRFSERSCDIVYQLTLSAHSMKNKEILKILNYALYNNELEDTSHLFLLMEELKRINLADSCEVKRARKRPVILIIDSELDLIPWEMLSMLSYQPVSRILSLHLLYALFKYHQSNIIGGYRMIKLDNGFSLVNPNGDLHQCEKEIGLFLKNHLPWIESEVGRVPDPKALVAKFQQYSLFFYCGHGSGMQYLKSDDFKNAFVKGLVLLFGCSSNLPKSDGGRTPYKNDTYTYLTNGCPCLIGCIFDITSYDADKACKEILSTCLPTVGKKDSKLVIRKPKDPDILRSFIAGKLSCEKYWSQCSFVARGIPCKLEMEGSDHLKPLEV